jgi:hypothetical protein
MFCSGQAIRFLLGSWLKSWRRAKLTTRRSNAGRQCLLLEPLEDRCLMNVYTVTNTNDMGPGSLRQAIFDVNNDDSGSRRIVFSMFGTQVIYPTSPLPMIIKPVEIDGRSEPGYDGRPVISIDGVFAGQYVAGLFVDGGDSRILALNIRNFGVEGIVLYGRGGNYIGGCTIGTDRLGNFPMPNGDAGVAIFSESNHIGGEQDADLQINVISGNYGPGVGIYESHAIGNIVDGNNIGVNRNMDAVIPNHRGGGDL